VTVEAKGNFPSLKWRIYDFFQGKRLAYELSGFYSFRTSDYRIIYRIREKELFIIVITVGHRKEIYKKLKKIFNLINKPIIF
jgi:mRNA-degrading endonuclease RelE of RelBE toxin-antitoxin system